MQITSYILGAVITPSFAKSGNKFIIKQRYKKPLQNPVTKVPYSVQALSNRYKKRVMEQKKEVGQVSGVFRNNRNNRKENGGGYVQSN